MVPVVPVIIRRAAIGVGIVAVATGIAAGAVVVAAIAAGISAVRAGMVLFVEPRRHVAATPTGLVAVAPARWVGTAIPAAVTAAVIPVAMLGKGRRRHPGADHNSRDQRSRDNTPSHNNHPSTIILLVE